MLLNFLMINLWWSSPSSHLVPVSPGVHSIKRTSQNAGSVREAQGTLSTQSAAAYSAQGESWWIGVVVSHPFHDDAVKRMGHGTDVADYASPLELYARVECTKW